MLRIHDSRILESDSEVRGRERGLHRPFLLAVVLSVPAKRGCLRSKQSFLYLSNIFLIR